VAKKQWRNDLEARRGRAVDWSQLRSGMRVLERLSSVPEELWYQEGNLTELSKTIEMFTQLHHEANALSFDRLTMLVRDMDVPIGLRAIAARALAREKALYGDLANIDLVAEQLEAYCRTYGPAARESAREAKGQGGE
jgi:hypothetical protein